jgi:hypothetical protein
MREAIDQANRAGVSFYGVDARGLGAGLDEAIDIGGVPADDPTFMSPTSMIQNEVRRAQDNMRVMSEQTGGFAIINQNDLNAAFQRIVEDNSSYYVLGAPSNDKRDSGFAKSSAYHAAGVRAGRNGYTAPKGSLPRSPAHAPMRVPPRLWMRSPAYTGNGVGLSIFAAPSVELDRRRPSRCRSNSRRRP